MAIAEDEANISYDETIEPIVSFGLIADIQYADNEDRWNYTKTHLRRYRNALKLVDEACQYWKKRMYPISFILQLGDIIDGIAFTNGTSEQDLKSVLDTFRKTYPELPIYHIWGNHELYNFSRKDLLNGPICSFDTKDISPGHYGTIEVCPNLRIIALDTYEFSALGVEKEDPIYIQAMDLLKKHNTNENPNDPTNLRGHQRRFVQFNGGLTSTQLNWLKDQLTQAQNRNDKIIIIGHVPVHPSACDHLDLLWNYKEVLDLFWLFDNTILAYIAGHDHDGGYFRDRKNIHHLTLHAVVECELNTNSFATVNVFKDRILIEGVGRIGTYEIEYREKLIMRLYNRVVLMHRKQIWQPWVAQGRSALNYATEHIPHVVFGVPFAAFFILVIASKEIYKANAYQFNVYKRRLMVRRPDEVPLEYRPFCS